jgi:hypothetical protein
MELNPYSSSVFDLINKTLRTRKLVSRHGRLDKNLFLSYTLHFPYGRPATPASFFVQLVPAAVISTRSSPAAPA